MIQWRDLRQIYVIYGKYIVATEIEFYLFDSDNSKISEYFLKLPLLCADCGLEIFRIEKERGLSQYEISLRHSENIEKIIADTEQLKKISSDLAASYNMKADFSARPLADDYGSGLHIHVHMEDAEGNNLYWKKDDQLSDMLAYSLGGLLATMRDNMKIFAPDEKSRKRFVAGGNAPTTVSWGANNRTCALRLPDKPWNDKHIEHRVSCADVDVKSAVQAVLSGIDYGIANKLTPPPQIYGDASLTMYELPRLTP